MKKNSYAHDLLKATSVSVYFVLQEVGLKEQSESHCEDIFGGHSMKGSLICHSLETKKDTCQGWHTF